MPQLQALDVYAQTNQTLTLYARDASNNPQDLTGMTIAWRVGFPPVDPADPDAVITKTGTVVNAAAGTFTVALVPDDTKWLPCGNYLHEAFATNNSTTAVTVVTRGRFRLRSILETS